MKPLIWIEPAEVWVLHGRLVALFGGPSGVRDSSLLESALARPRQIESYGEGWDVAGLAAAYTAGIVKNHPFADGNKRTGFVVGILFLELNGYQFAALEEEAAQAVISLAEGSLDEAGYAEFLRAKSERTGS